MDVGDGGVRETAEWVNALLAAFWSLLQPVVTRYIRLQSTIIPSFTPRFGEIPVPVRLITEQFRGAIKTKMSQILEKI